MGALIVDGLSNALAVKLDFLSLSFKGSGLITRGESVSFDYVPSLKETPLFLNDKPLFVLLRLPESLRSAATVFVF